MAITPEIAHLRCLSLTLSAAAVRAKATTATPALRQTHISRAKARAPEDGALKAEDGPKAEDGTPKAKVRTKAKAKVKARVPEKVCTSSTS